MSEATIPRQTASATRRAPSLLYVVKAVELAIRAHLEDAVKPFGVTMLQYTALTVLEREESITAADLARLSFVRAQSAADIVAALERGGYITRRRDPQQRRRLLIELTPEGHALLERCAPAVAAVERDAFSGLDADELDALRSGLSRTRRNLSARERS